MIFNKKAQTFNILVIAIIAIAVLAFIMLFFFGNVFPKATGSFGSLFGTVEDTQCNIDGDICFDLAGEHSNNCQPGKLSVTYSCVSNKCESSIKVCDNDCIENGVCT